YQLRDKIVNGDYDDNTKIPAEDEIALIYGVSRMTARSAVTYLVNEDLVYRVHGKGAFVLSKKIKRNFNKLNDFQNDMEALGMRSSSKLLKFTKRMPTQKEQQ